MIGRRPFVSTPGALCVLCLFCVMAAVAGCSGPTGGGTSTADQQFVSGDGTVTTWSAADRPAAPAVRATTLEGGTVDLASYRGKVVVLNFWASWCAPCRVEGPALQGLAADLKPEGVEFVGIDGADDADAARAFLTDIGSSYPNVDDSSGDVALAFHKLIPPAFPSTLVIDRQGRVAARVSGPTTQPRLKALLAPLVASP
ncbi:MAG: TlpA family protein disulfide reductase [Actinomycetes bacterium]